MSIELEMASRLDRFEGFTIVGRNLIFCLWVRNARIIRVEHIDKLRVSPLRRAQPAREQQGS